MWVPKTHESFRKGLTALSKGITSLTLNLSYVFSLYMILAFFPEDYDIMFPASPTGGGQKQTVKVF